MTLTSSSIASLLENVYIPRNQVNTSVACFSSDEASNFNFFLVAICHQTQTLNGYIDGKQRRGWDYLSAKLEKERWQKQMLLWPQYWAQVDEKGLGKLFSNPRLGDTFADKACRATLIRDMGSVMLANN